MELAVSLVRPSGPVAYDAWSGDAVLKLAAVAVCRGHEDCNGSRALRHVVGGERFLRSPQQPQLGCNDPVDEGGTHGRPDLRTEADGSGVVVVAVRVRPWCTHGSGQYRGSDLECGGVPERNRIERHPDIERVSEHEFLGYADTFGPAQPDRYRVSKLNALADT